MEIYTCPMHPEIRQETPGYCSKCGMPLVSTNSSRQSAEEESNVTTEHSFITQYKPLIVIIGLILLVTAVTGVNDNINGIFSVQKTMAVFMSGFFLVFSGFKLLDIQGFVHGYTTYDLLAKKLMPYGYMYPFIELLLGISYIFWFHMGLLNIITFIIMTFSGIGVAINLIKHEQFQCACLGTVFKLPLTKVTLLEDFGMAIMAILMLVIH